MRMSLDVSPTYLSGDHFAPLAKPKKLLSRRTGLSTFYKANLYLASVRKTKENWGSNAKSYGGIGVLLLSRKPCETKGGKGLLVSRGHHHMGSGVHKFHPVPQPYQVTSLSKSACRPSDQLLPNVNHVDLISISKESSLFASKKAESSFKPIFDVFPSFDISQKDKKGDTDKPLNKRKSPGTETIQALHEITKEIYKTTNHQRDYPKRSTAQGRRSRAKTVTFGHELSKNIMDMFHGDSTQLNEECPRCVICACQISLKDFSENLTDVAICNYCKSTGIFRVNKEPFGSNSDIKLAPLQGIHSEKFHSPKQDNDNSNNSLVLKLSKPPSEFTRIYASPLNYLGYYSGRHRNRLSALIRKDPAAAPDTIPVHDGTDTKDVDSCTSNRQVAKRIDLKRITIPISLKNKDILKEKGICCSDLFLLKEDRREKASLKDVLPMIYFPLHSETKTTPTTKYGDIEEADGKDQPQSPPAVIKRFKSVANKRYHEKYRDNIPDLRESRIDAKKHFFSGYHASVFRG